MLTVLATDTTSPSSWFVVSNVTVIILEKNTGVLHGLVQRRNTYIVQVMKQLPSLKYEIMNTPLTKIASK